MEDSILLISDLARKWDELKFLAGPAEVSPEGNPTLGKDALVYKIFDAVDLTAIEADRTFLGVILFAAALKRDLSKFPHLSPERFLRLYDFTVNILENNQKFIDLTMYALATNDLGKTKPLIDINISLRGRKAPDHDQLLAEVVNDKPELFSGLWTLDPEQQEQYKDGLRFNFNLGQLVQGENLPYNLYATGDVPRKSKRLRLLAEVFDFAGATGHINWKFSIVMNDTNCELFLRAVEAILEHEHTADEEIATLVYVNYLRYRAERCGLHSHHLFYLFGKIAALSRVTDVASGKLIVQVWHSLGLREQEVLLREMLQDGFHKKGILIYYYPALIANAIKATGDFCTGLKTALQSIVVVYESVRAKLIKEGISDEPGVYTENVSALAKEMNLLPRVDQTNSSSK